MLSFTEFLCSGVLEELFNIIITLQVSDSHQHENVFLVTVP